MRQLLSVLLIGLPMFESAVAQTSAGSAPLRFDVWEFRVAGNSLLSTTDLERTVYPYLGENKIIDDIETARKALEQRYHDAGFPTVLVDIPEQDVNEGVVQLNVTEGRIEKIRVVGAKYFSPKRIKNQISNIREGAVPSLPSLQTALVSLNRASPDRSVVPVLKPGASAGSMDLELKVRDQLPVHASVEANNQGSASTSPYRLIGAARYDNLWQREHSISMQFQVSPEHPDEVRVWSGTYLFGLPNADRLVAVYRVHSDSNVATIGGLKVIGRGNVWGVREMLPLASGQNFSQSLALGADLKDFAEDLRIAETGVPVSTPIRYTVFSVQYSATHLVGSSNQRFRAGTNFAIRGLADRSVDCEIYDAAIGAVSVQSMSEFSCKRANAKANFIYFRIGAARDVTLPLGMGFSVDLDSQIATAPLISNEQFSAGGMSSVRGYAESQFMGDSGLRLALELASPSFGDKLGNYLKFQRLQATAFTEAAALYLKDPLPGQDKREGLLGAGLGLRVTAWKNVSAAIDVAWPLRSSGSRGAGNFIEAGKAKLHFIMQYSL